MSRPFAVPSELAAFMQEDVPEETARLALSAVSATIRTYCGWSISAEKVEGLRVRSHRGSQALWLPTLHLRSVDSLSYGMTELSPDTHYHWEPEGRISVWGHWRPGGTYTVSFSHGYLDTHPAIESARIVCLAAAARLVDNPTAHRQETVGGEAVIASGASSDLIAILAAGEQAQLDPYRLPVLG